MGTEADKNGNGKKQHEEESREEGSDISTA